MSPLSRSQLLKGTTEMLILGVIENERLHGYDILQRIRDAGSGLIVSEGALYPALHRLEHRGWISAEWAVSELGRRAKYYTLTAAGRRQLAIEADGWERMSSAIGRVMKLA